MKTLLSVGSPISLNTCSSRAPTAEALWTLPRNSMQSAALPMLSPQRSMSVFTPKFLLPTFRCWPIFLRTSFSNRFLPPWRSNASRTSSFRKSGWSKTRLMSCIHVLFQEDFWKQNPLGLPIYGTVESVEKTGRQQMIDFVASRFNPGKNRCSSRRKPRSSEFSGPDRSRHGNAQPFKPNSRSDSSGSSFLLKSRKKGPRTGTPGDGHAGDFADR